jgi:hypothetical protein
MVAAIARWKRGCGGQLGILGGSAVAARWQRSVISGSPVAGSAVAARWWRCQWWQQQLAGSTAMAAMAVRGPWWQRSSGRQHGSWAEAAWWLSSGSKQHDSGNGNSHGGNIWRWLAQ